MTHFAIVGSGISGLTAAYLLSKKHQVSVFEKNSVIGGHTATVDVEISGKQYAIDTGFIVFNDRTYPNFLKLLNEINVEKQETEMSFSVHNQQTGLEYNGHTLSTLFAQKRNIFNVKFWCLLKEILRFNKLCKKHFIEKTYPENYTLGDFLNEHHFNDAFSENYILPMGAAIWSSSLEQMALFPFHFFSQFFYHHGLLNVNDRPQWYVIPGGSRSYLQPLTSSFKENIHTNSNIQFITRENNKVQLHFANNVVEEFDELILACHSDQALALLKDATEQEKSILSAMQYGANDVVLHTDQNLLPKRKKAWASWNYQLNNNREQPASVTYNMNILQGLKNAPTFCVTLNQNNSIDKNKILKSFIYHHPIFSNASLAAQQKRAEICGKNHTHFAGAYWYNGFHEDGVKSAIDVGNRFNCHIDENEVTA